MTAPPPGAPGGGGVGVDPPPDWTTAEMHAALVAALVADGYEAVEVRPGARIWRKRKATAVQPTLLWEDAA